MNAEIENDLHLNAYKDAGFVLLRDVVDRSALDSLEMRFLGLVEELCGRKFENVADPELATFLAGNRELERELYDGVREFPWLIEFSMDQSITKPVTAILGKTIGLMEKIPLRIDLPMVLRELAVWHQDHYYVKGNTDIVTAWVPLQDTAYEAGCLMVMPSSHKHGIIAHDRPLLGKKHVPSGIYDWPVRYVEMKRGDLLLFNSLLLHSSGVNITNHARLSVQARFSRLEQATDPGMGRLIPLEKGKRP